MPLVSPSRRFFRPSSAADRAGSSRGVGFPVDANKVPFSRTLAAVRAMARRTDLDLTDDQRFALMKVLPFTAFAFFFFYFLFSIFEIFYRSGSSGTISLFDPNAIYTPRGSYRTQP